MNFFALWMTRVVVLVMLLLVSMLLIFPLYLLLQGMIDRHVVVRAIMGILLVAWFLLMSQVANATASRMVVDNLGFGDALRVSVVEARVMIGFLPLIGKWVAPKSGAHEAKPNSPIE